MINQWIRLVNIFLCFTYFYSTMSLCNWTPITQWNRMYSVQCMCHRLRHKLTLEKHLKLENAGHMFYHSIILFSSSRWWPHRGSNLGLRSCAWVFHLKITVWKPTGCMSDSIPFVMIKSIINYWEEASMMNFYTEECLYHESQGKIGNYFVYL